MREGVSIQTPGLLTSYLDVFDDGEPDPYSLPVEVFDGYDAEATEEFTDVDIGRFDNIAFRLYGDSGLCFFIQLLNQVADPFNDKKPGELLKVSAYQDIFTLFERCQRYLIYKNN